MSSRYKPDAPVCSIEGCEVLSRKRGLCGPHYSQHMKDLAGPCTIEGCPNKIEKLHLYCGTHYRRYRLFGDPLGKVGPKPTRLCSVEGCGRKHHSGGYCDLHDGRLRRHGFLHGRPPEPDKVCHVERCEEPYYSLGYCLPHYSRLKKYGDPLGGGLPYRKRIRHISKAEFIAQALAYDGDDCLVWPFAVNDRGYGSIWVTDADGSKRSAPAHRHILELAAGPPPGTSREWFACHAPVICHNPSCVNPRHLRWDTPAGNNADMIPDETAPRGERSPNALLSETQARAIRNDHRAHSLIAADYGVSTATVSSIKSGRNWGWMLEAG